MHRGAFADTLWLPFDSARAGVLRWLSPWVAPLFADRSRRVLWVGVVSVLLAFVLTGVAPLWLFALGPVVLGVPHLVSDVRYLVVQPGLHRNRWLMGAMAVPLLAVAWGAGPLAGLLTLVPAVLLGRWSRAVPLALLGTLGLLALAWRDDFAFQLAFLHLHNVVALALWFFLRPRPLSHAWIPGLTLSGAALILGGALDPVVTAMGGWSAPSSGADFGDLVTTHTQGLEPTLAARAVLSFCFLQSVHYAVWLRLIPDDARERRAPRTFRASWRALVHDFGLPALLFVAALALLIGGWGVVNLAAARDGYLRLAAFHGYLELAIAARWFTQGRSP